MEASIHHRAHQQAPGSPGGYQEVSYNSFLQVKTRGGAQGTCPLFQVRPGHHGGAHEYVASV